MDCLSFSYTFFLYNDKNIFQIDGQNKMEVNTVMDELMNKLMKY